jgi:hypothetical protein
MTIYARLDPVTNALSALVDLTPEQYATMQANGKALFLRLYIIDAQPAPSAAQKVIEGAPLITATEYHKTWSLVNKTQAELDADAQAAELVQLKAMVAALTTVIDAGVTTAPTTLAEAVTKIQAQNVQLVRLARVARWLIKQQQ